MTVYVKIDTFEGVHILGVYTKEGMDEDRKLYLREANKLIQDYIRDYSKDFNVVLLNDFSGDSKSNKQLNLIKEKLSELQKIQASEENLIEWYLHKMCIVYEPFNLNDE